LEAVVTGKVKRIFIILRISVKALGSSITILEIKKNYEFHCPVLY
jgi:hypothetical protein